MQHKRILWLTENYPPQRGGMAQSCDRIVSGLRKTGFIIDVLHFTSKGSSFISKQQQNGTYTPIAFEDSEAHVLNITWNHIKGQGSFDYLVCFGGYLSMIGASIFAKWSGIPLITFIRGNDFDTAIFTPRKRPVLEETLRESSHVFSVSEDKIEKIEKWLPGVKVKYVPNGIDLNEWEPTKSETDFAAHWRKNEADGKICLGLIGQLKPKKGIHFFLDTLSRTRFTGDTHLLLIGDVADELLEKVEAHGISYTSLPFHDRYELMKYYLSCDAIVIPSFYEGMPNVMLESGALGIPVLASSVDGMKSVIEHGKDGLLFQPGNEDDCRRTLYSFFEMDEKQRKELGRQLKNKIEDQYTTTYETEAYQSYLS